MLKVRMMLFLSLAACSAVSQDCSNCKMRPSVAQYDLDVHVPRPVVQGEKTQGWLEWLQLFWVGKHINAYLFQNSLDCIRFKQPPSAEDNDKLIVGQTYVNLPPPGDLSRYGNYLTTGVIRKAGNNYILRVEIQSACNRETVASSEVTFQLSAESSNTMRVAQQAAANISPLITHIKSYELKQRGDNKKFVLAGNDAELIHIKPQKKSLVSGQTTELHIELRDCDGRPLAGREIVFTKGSVGGFPITGTIGGVVTPAKVVTDAQGKAKASFKMSAGAGKPAIINAHSLVQSPSNCEDALIGSAKIDALPGIKISVSYIKSGLEEFNLDSDEDGVAFKAGEQKKWEVASSYTAHYYSPGVIKDGQQIIMMSDDGEGGPVPEEMGKLVVTSNEGYSEFTILDNPLALVKSPVGAPPKPSPTRDNVFSSSPLPPTLSMIFENNNLVFFSSAVNFPENEEGGNPLSADFGIEKNDKKFFPVKPEKVTDPNSPYKWKYEFKYHNKESNDISGSVLKAGSSETESAVITIWKSF